MTKVFLGRLIFLVVVKEHGNPHSTHTGKTSLKERGLEVNLEESCKFHVVIQYLSLIFSTSGIKQ